MTYDARLQALVAAMGEALERGDEIYRPSAFWSRLNKEHEQQIAERGFLNFKLDANQHYFNWMVSSLQSPLMERLISLWPSNLDDSVVVTVFENPEIFPSAYLAEIYRLYVSLLWGFTNKEDKLGFFDKIEEPQFGNPIRIKRHDRYISQDVCNSYREFQTIVQQPTGRVFGELGSGYGRLGYIFGMLTNARYCFFDIPPALGIAQVYFETIFSDKKIFAFREFSEFDEIRDELSECQFAFFTANQIKQFPDRYFDTFINISSLQEMALPQIKNYLSQMDRLTSKAIYLKQYVRHENDQDGIVVTSNDYDLPNHWQVTLDQPDAVIPEFFERLLLRR